MPDIALMGAVYPDVPAVILPVDGGGTAKFTYGWDWRGVDVEFMEAFYPKVTKSLDDTTFPDWTPSTTAVVIQASTTAASYTLDMANYEYLVRWQFRFDAAYNTGATLKNQTYRECADIWQTAFKRTSSVANIATKNLTYNSLVTWYTAPLHVYYGNTTNTLTYTHSVSYGIYPAVVSATWSSTTSDTPKLTIKAPTVSARCNATQFAVGRAPELDTANSKFSIKGTIYRMATGSAMRCMTEGLYDIYNNGFD